MGWIRIDRDIFKHEFFARAPMSEREAWVWMIARAAWKDTRHRVGAKMLPVPRGSFFATQREMQGIFGWKSHKRVQTFLDRLASEGMITVTAAPGKSQITICNYGLFQDAGAKREQAGTEPSDRTEQLPLAPPPVADITDREQLLVAMELPALSSSGRIYGNQTDMLEARRWKDELGLSIDDQVSVISEVMGRKADGPPSAFKYFTAAMQRRAAEKARPRLQPDAGSPPAAQPPKIKRARVKVDP